MTNVEKFLAALLAPFQALEDAQQQLLIDRRVDTAIGAQLDVVGRLVGLERNGISDDDIYRRHIRAEVATNKSDGVTEDLIAVVQLIVFDNTALYRVTRSGHATVVVRIEDIAIDLALAAVVIQFLRRAKSGGVRLVLEYGISPPADWFRFDSGPGFDVGRLIGAVE